MTLTTCFPNLEKSRSEFHGSKLLPLISNAHLSTCIKTKLTNGVAPRNKATSAGVVKVEVNQPLALQLNCSGSGTDPLLHVSFV